jgi:hypothetical protein
MITYEQALSAAEAYVREHRPWAVVDALLEDDRDFFPILKLAPNSGNQWPMGPGPFFISKASGRVWSDAYSPAVLDRIDGMRQAWTGRSQDATT